MTELPKRSMDTLSDAIAMSSPNGRMSQRAKAAASQRLGRALFGDYDPHKRQPPTIEERRISLLRHASFLRGLVAKGMGVRKYAKAADKAEAEAAALAD